LDDYSPRVPITPKQSAALDAIKAIDTNAIPFLLRWMDSGQRPLEFLGRTQTNLSFLRPLTLPIMRHFEKERIRAIVGLMLLGDRAAPAAPGLAERFARGSKYEARQIGSILFRMGDAGFEIFAHAITNRNHPHRDVALNYVLFFSRFDDRNHGPAASVVLKVARDTNDPMANAATETIGMIGVVTDEVLTMLTNKLTTGDVAAKRSALKAIADLGVEAEPLLPTVESALHDPDTSVRTHAAYTYARLNREKAHNDHMSH
jgi:hypothetical protein